MVAFARWAEFGRNAGYRADDRDRRDTTQGRWHKGRSSLVALLILAAALSALVVSGGARAATVAGVTSGSLAVEETGAARDLRHSDRGAAGRARKGQERGILGLWPSG